MSRPRKPFGSNQPGRLQSTMMKVLAAEMSDPQRSRKGKRYAADGSVIDITIEEGTVVAEVQGSRATPYVATLEVSPGDGMPLRRDLHAHCSCPDDDNWNDRICKHVVALMYVFADELLIEPELLDVWRANDRTDAADPSGDHDRTTADAEHADGDDDDLHDDDVDDRPQRRRHLHLVRDGVEAARRERDQRDRDAPAEPEPEPELIDPLHAVVGVPRGHTIPFVPVLDPVDPPLPRRPELGALLRDAMRELRIDWD